MYSPAGHSRPGTPQSSCGQEQQNDCSSGGRPPRPMQIKVLYTFDTDSKTNCLARCPNPMLVQTAFLDALTEVGIIELRTCVQAIVAASPELVAKLGKDYTVYAYDYSEYETPLVGQGMLSWVLAAASATPNAPAHESRTMVTGRVVRGGGMGLFGTGVKEMLEVKLRLVPVPTCLQNEYLEGMEKYRDTKNVINEGFDAGAWTTFLRENPGFGAPVQQPTPTTSTPSFTFDTTAISATNTPLYAPNTPIDGFFQNSGFDEGVLYGNHGGGPSQGVRRDSYPSTPSHQRTYQAAPGSRPSSRASNQGRPSLKHTTSSMARMETQSGQDTFESADDGPTRKRARVEKANWRGPSVFTGGAESLRVAASTAASMRGHGPPSLHPSASDLAATETANRPPTPRPHSNARKQPGLLRTATSLAHEAMTHKFDPGSPTSMSDYAVTSPEESNAGSSAASTPMMDIPSSPPVLRPVSPTPSSPALPAMPPHADSGYVGGSGDGYDGEDELRPLDDDDTRIAARYRQHSANPLPSELSITEEMPGDPGLLPGMRKILPRPPGAPASEADLQNSKKKRDRSKRSQGPDNNTTAMQPIEIAPTPQPIEIAPTPQSHGRPRSESVSQDPAQRPSSPAVDGAGKTKGTAFSQKRKQAIQERLASSIAAGEMPPFCGNCGEVDTPTWRKTLVRVEQGSPDESKIFVSDEGIICWEAVTKDDEGKVTSFKVLKKAQNGVVEFGWEELQLCNSCGLWLQKFKCQRPPEKWVKEKQKDAGPRKRSKKKASESQTAEPPSEPAQQSESNFYENGGTNPDWEIDNKAREAAPVAGATAPAQRSQRSNSVSAAECPRQIALRKTSAVAALQRAIQSSPPKFPGSKFSPINLDEDNSPQKTRRLLFPSPRKPGEIKSLEGKEMFESEKPKQRENDSPPPEIAEKADDKENQKPRRGDDDDFKDLFDAGENAATPSTPRSKRSSRDATKTPTASSRRRVGLTPRSGALPSNGSSRRWRNNPLDTPSRVREEAGPMLAPEQMTPFTAQLTQLISEANALSPSRGTSTADDALALFSDQLHSDATFFNFEDYGMHDDMSSDLPMPIVTNQSHHGLFSAYDHAMPSSEGPWSDDQFMDASIDAFLQEQNHETAVEGGECLEEEGTANTNTA